MNELETALRQHVRKLASNAKLGKNLRQDLVAGVEAHLSTIMTSRGELVPKRVRKCRAAAVGIMPTTMASQKRLASMVDERRIPNPEFRQDLQQLLSLSQHCRAALAALPPTADRRAAEALGNKVLIELLEATLLYVSTARAADHGGTEKARAAIVEQLKKTEGHADAFVALAPGSDDPASLGATLSKDVVEMLHRTSLDWSAAAEPFGSEAAQ